MPYLHLYRLLLAPGRKLSSHGPFGLVRYLLANHLVVVWFLALSLPWTLFILWTDILRLTSV